MYNKSLALIFVSIDKWLEFFESILHYCDRVSPDLAALQAKCAPRL
jgi:hypothetical protein